MQSNQISQQRVQEMIKRWYGVYATALGHSIIDGVLTIFWHYVTDTDDTYYTAEVLL